MKKYNKILSILLVLSILISPISGMFTNIVNAENQISKEVSNNSVDETVDVIEDDPSNTQDITEEIDKGLEDLIEPIVNPEEIDKVLEDLIEVIENPEPIVNPTIKLINQVANIKVEYGTTKEEVLKMLETTTTIIDSEEVTYLVDLTWTIPDYNVKEAGEYTAISTFELPEDVDQPEPAIDLEVKATVTVKEEDKPIVNILTIKEEDKPIGNTLTIKEQIQKNLAFILLNTPEPTFGTGGGDWSILSLARGGYSVPEGYYDIYYNNVVQKVMELMPEKGKLHKAKGTEHSRLMLGFGSIGKDIKNVGGYDIRDALADYQYVIKQGINGPIFALIALDTNNYEIPIIKDVKIQTTKDMLIKFILDKEIGKDNINTGGWALSGTTPDPDITAMAIQGLTPYYNRSDVKAAVDRALNWLSKAQHDDGGYSSWGSVNSESIAQVVVALTGLGIDPNTDSRFIKKGNSTIDALMTYALPEGGFMHVKPGGNTGGGGAAGKVDGMATDQGTYALVAYDRFVEGKTRLYDMTDSFEVPDIEVPIIEVEGLIDGQILTEPELIFKVVAKDNSGKDIIPDVRVNGQIITRTDEIYKVILSDGKNIITIEATDKAGNKQDITYEITYQQMYQPIINVPTDNKDYNITIKPEDINKEIKINIPKEKGGKVIVELPLNKPLPKIEANKGYISAEISKGIKIISGDSSALEMITSKSSSDQELISKVTNTISRDERLEKIDEVFSMGGNKKIEFSDYITLTFKGSAGKNAAYIQDEQIYKINKYTNNQAGKNSKELVYAYDYGNDLIVKTKHFTDFLVYTTSMVKDEEGNSGGGATKPNPTPNPTPKKAYITLSIDKDTIGKKAPLSPTKVEITEGESVWDVLKREMDKRGIEYEYTFTAKYNSVYIEWIDGDGEFDHGSGSGWMYNVDGWYPNYGASVYKLKDGDVVQWRYTTDLGADLGEDIAKWDQPTITVEGIKNNQVFQEDEIKFVVIAKSTYGPIKGEDASLTVKLNGRTLSKTAGKYTATLLDGENILEIIATDSQGNRKDETYKLIYKLDERIGSKKPWNLNTSGKSLNKKESILDKEQEEIKEHLGNQYKDSRSISSWALESIKRGTELGFVEGYNDQFNPKSNITRVEFTKIMTSVLGLETRITKKINFSDVKENDWFYSYVNAAYEAGIVLGDGNKFNPNDNITREQMAAIMVRALGLKHEKSNTIIKDIDKVSSWAKKDVETVVALGLIVGYNGNFDPKSNGTREMGTVVAIRGYDYKNNNETEENEDKTEPTIKHLNVEDQIKNTSQFMQKMITTPIVGSVGGEWTVFGLARSGEKIPESYYERYYANVEKTLKEKSGKLHRIKYTEYDRVILALTSIGRDINNVAGYNLTKPLADFDTLIIQGINGPIFALIALDSNNYEIPIVEGVKTQTTREMLIDFILEREIDGGGWALGENAPEADPDITGMAIQGLTPYYDRPEVKSAVDRAIIWLSKAQKQDGGYSSWGSINSESISQVVVALTGLGIDPHNDPRFIKNGHSVMEALLEFGVKEGGFYHVRPGGVGNGGAEPGDIDGMATDQGMYAMIAYDRFVKGHNRLYDMTDVK